ncbi:MAG: universal stress protein [Chloroflexi bacterium]|nr:universal stress protein [Chloroflexota bacterium]
MFRKILVGTNGSTRSKRAIETAVELALVSGAELHILGVLEPQLPSRSLASSDDLDEARRVLGPVVDQALRHALARGVTSTSTEVRVGSAAQEIVDTAERGGFDLIVLGVHGNSLGSTTDRVTHHAHCSVHVVR